MKGVLAMALGMLWGWLWAHHEIATECRLQNSFYVGSSVYQCQPK